MPRVAFHTFAVLRAAPGSPEVQGFFDRVARTFVAAERAEGFIARSMPIAGTDMHTWGEPVAPRFFRAGEHADAPRTLSLWRDLAAVHAYAYGGVHAEALRRRSEWFVRPEWPPYVAWWVADDHVPDWREAAERLEHLHDHGATPYAFDFKHPFGPDGEPATLERRRD